MKIDFGLGLGRHERMSEIVQITKVAEQEGFSHVTFVDQPYMSPDPVVCMTIAALNSKRLRIGQGVTDPINYNSLVLANTAVSMTELTGGRYFVGIGAGGPFGKVQRPAKIRQMRESVEFIREFTAGKIMEWNGEKIQ